MGNPEEDHDSAPGPADLNEELQGMAGARQEEVERDNGVHPSGRPRRKVRNNQREEFIHIFLILSFY